MYQLIGESDFAQSMRTHAGWPYSASCAFYWFLEDVDSSVDGFGIELDPVAFYCEFKVYNSFEEYIEDTGLMVNTLEELQDHTTVIEVGDGSLVVQGW